MIDLWLMQNNESNLKDSYSVNIPDFVVGSHDSLLEWALRESSFPPAMQATGGLEVLCRFVAGEYNVPAIKWL